MADPSIGERMKDQQKAIRAARTKLGITSEELAERMGVSLPTMRAWLLPKTSKAHRNMPKAAELLLGHILADGKQEKARR